MAPSPHPKKDAKKKGPGKQPDPSLNNTHYAEMLYGCQHSDVLGTVGPYDGRYDGPRYDPARVLLRGIDEDDYVLGIAMVYPELVLLGGIKEHRVVWEDDCGGDHDVDLTVTKNATYFRYSLWPIKFNHGISTPIDYFVFYFSRYF